MKSILSNILPGHVPLRAAHAGQDIACTLQKINPQKESSQWVLHTPAHLGQIAQNVLPAVLIGLDVDSLYSDEEVKHGHDVSGVLDQFVQISHLATDPRGTTPNVLTRHMWLSTAHSTTWGREGWP